MIYKHIPTTILGLVSYSVPVRNSPHTLPKNSQSITARSAKNQNVQVRTCRARESSSSSSRKPKLETVRVPCENLPNRTSKID